MPVPVDPRIEAKLHQARVARLATADAEGRPHLIPVCFAWDGTAFYTAVDRKPKKPGAELQRVRNLRANRNVALLLDEYDEDWNQLWYVLVRGQGAVLPDSQGDERAKALHLLREKYPQYRGRLLPDDAPVIRITPEKVVSWGV